MPKVNERKCAICERVLIHDKPHMCQPFGPGAAYETVRAGRPRERKCPHCNRLLDAVIYDGHECVISRPGRPPVAGAARAEFVRARVTAEEKARVLASAEALGLSLSDYVREKLGL